MQKEWQIQDLLGWTKQRFEGLGIKEPRLEAEVLLSHALKMDRISLYVNYDRPVDAEERNVFRTMVKRRMAGEPAAYIIGEKEFMSLPFAVDSRVLIPRPDTEIMVEESLRLAALMGGQLLAADIGTGSGALAISTAKYIPGIKVYAVDIDEQALQVARSNAILNGVEDRIDFVRGNLLEMLPDSVFDLIMANLPYIPSEAMADLPREVREFEPHSALDGGPRGTRFYRELMDTAYGHLAPGGYLLMEISDDGQAQELLTNENKWWKRHYMLKDLGNRYRVLVLVKGE